jgi:hypothetical protein
MATELEKIISVSGKSGLFKVVSAGKVAVLAESLVDGKRQPILSTQRVSTLADIGFDAIGSAHPSQVTMRRHIVGSA